MMMARAKPAPPRMSSMPYGPPDTMKYVAAMSGNKRILRRAGLGATGIDVNVTKSEAPLRRNRRDIGDWERGKRRESSAREGEIWE